MGIPVWYDKSKLDRKLRGKGAQEALGIIAGFTIREVRSDRGYRDVTRGTREISRAYFEQLLQEQRDLALKHFNIPPAAEVKTGGITYLTWPAQFKVSGITVVDASKASVGEPKSPYVGVHHDGEYDIDRKHILREGRPKCSFAPTFSRFPLVDVPTLAEIRRLAKEKAIEHDVSF